MVAGGRLSVDAILQHGYAAKNMIDFYRMLNPKLEDDAAALKDMVQRKSGLQFCTKQRVIMRVA